MRHVFRIALFLLLPRLAWAQDDPMRATEQALLREGRALYQSERASWLATDLLMAQKPDLKDMVGYVSYAEGDSVRTVFFQQAHEAAPLVARYIFSFPHHTLEPAAGRQTSTRPASTTEHKLFTVRRNVLHELNQHQVAGKPYGFPKNTRPNVAILHQDNNLRAYVLTGPQESGVLPIGNDFLFTIGPDLRVSAVEPLHSTYLAMKIPPDQKVTTGMHTHLPAHPYITATDICSLLLYQDTFPVRQHLVVGQDYVSLFDASTYDILILTKQAFEKMAKSNRR